MFSCRTLKKLLYVFETVFGLLVCIFAVHMVKTAEPSVSSIVYELPGAIMFLAGLGCILLGVDTFMLREDPEIWW